MRSDDSARIGGSAAQTGFNYQNQVAAWFSVQILAEQESTPPWSLPADVTLDYLRCETEQPVDDLLVGTSEGGHAFIQVKHSVGLLRAEDSALASALRQFVRQFVSYGAGAVGNRSWERPLDPSRDRLVLITSSNSPRTMRDDLPSVLTRLRTLTPSEGIEDAAGTAAERALLNVIRTHLERLWAETNGSALTELVMRQLLTLLRIQILDFSEDEDEGREARNVLRSSILANPQDADAAWNLLVMACSEYASRRSGADRATLQQVLVGNGVKVVAPRSYRADIERIKQHSTSTLQDLRDLSHIHLGQRTIKVARVSSQSLRDASERHSMVVVGDAGSGKSGALHDLVERLVQESRDVVFLAVDRLEASSLGTLRQELGLENEIDATLRNWVGVEPGYLVIDALDAARSEVSAQTLYDLVSRTLEACPRWRVVASIRRFDLRHNTKLRRLFLGQPPTEFQSGEFFNLCHFNVPQIDEGEWQQIRQQAPELGVLFDAANQSLRELLHVPFNIRLIADLLGGGASVHSLTPIATQIALLDRYWQERVIGPDAAGDAREALLRRAVEVMVEARSLRANRGQVADASLSRALSQVLSAQILSEWEPLPGGPAERNVLIFAHHVLFDYATARLLLRGTPQTLINRLEGDASLVMAIRPSIVMHFQHGWLSDRIRFWDAVYRVIRSERIPEIGKLTGPTVAVESAVDTDGFAPLVDCLFSPDVRSRETAEKALRYVMGALLVNGIESPEFLVAQNAPAWGSLMDKCTREVRLETIYSVRPVLLTMCQHWDTLTRTQLFVAGRVARRILEFGLSRTERDSLLVAGGIEAVCRTFESDPSASALLLRQCLVPDHVLRFGHEELFHIGNEVEHLIQLDRALVEDIYGAAFTLSDVSEDATSVGRSRIVSLTSTRRQDFELSRYILASKYKQFIERAPLNATRVLIAALTTYVVERHSLGSGDEEEQTPFEFEGREAVIKTDHSEIWDSGHTYGNDNPLQMLEVFQNHLESISADDVRADERRQLLDLIAAENQWAVVWRRLLLSGAKLPATLGYELRSLAWATPILLSFDTTRAIGDLLLAIFSNLGLEDRERVERAILSVSFSTETDEPDPARHLRNRLLGCLNYELLVTEEAKAIVTEEPIPRNEPMFRMGQFGSKGYSDEDHLRDQGVPVDEEQNRRLMTFVEPVKAFAAKYLNTVPTSDEVEQMLPPIRALHHMLQTAEADDVHQLQRNLAWGYLAEACESASKTEEFSCETEGGSFIRDVLLEATNHPEPRHRPESDKDFDRHQGWGSPAARIDAAQGIMNLAHRTTCVDSSLLNAVRQLAGDAVPAVRFQVVVRLGSLYYSAPDLMWELLEQLSANEESRGVLNGLVRASLNRLAGHHPDRVTSLANNIYGRVLDGDGAAEVRKCCASIFAGLHLWRGHLESGQIVGRIADDPAKHFEEASQIVFDIPDLLNIGPVEPPNIEQNMVRARAFQLIERILDWTRRGVDALRAQNGVTHFDSWSDDDRETASKLARVADSICMQVYFASGAFKEGTEGSEHRTAPGGVAERARFLREADRILKLLSEFGYPSLTHYLLQTLEYLITFDPEEVFLLVGRVVRNGKAGNYQYESLAIDLIVRLVERSIAEFRHILQQNEECRRTLIEILDTFVDAGWARAQQLTYRMEEIFR